jgi:cell division septation protein DedD
MGLFPKAAEQRATRYPYTVQVSSYPDAKKAHRVAQGLRNRGDPAFTSPARIPGKGIWHRIFIGYYEDMAEAREAAKRLNQRRFRKTDVLMKPYALQVGLAHSENQLKQYLSDLAKGGHLAYWAPDHRVYGKIRVLSGAYATAEEAEAFVEPLRKLGFRPIVILR